MSAIARIKESISLPALAAEYTELRKSGGQYLCSCLWHSEKNPSCRIYEDHYYCYTCQSKGSVIDFVMQAEGVPFSGALRLLSERTGIQLDGERTTRAQKAYNREAYDFALWWWSRTLDFLSLQLTAYVCRLGYPYAGTTEEDCEELGALLMQVRGLNTGTDRRQKMIAASLRVTGATERREWEAWRGGNDWLAWFAVEALTLAC